MRKRGQIVTDAGRLSFKRVAGRSDGLPGLRLKTGNNFVRTAPRFCEKMLALPDIAEKKDCMKSEPLRVLAFTNLFPSRIEPSFAIFIYQRVASLARRNGNSVQVVAPVPFFPKWLRTKRWGTISQLPAEEKVGSLDVYHPRYLLLAKISMPLHGLLMYWGSLSIIRRLHAKAKIDCIDAHFVYPDGFAAVLVGRKLGIPVMVSARGTDINSYPSYKLIRPMIRWTLRNAAARVAVSSALKEKMMEVCGKDAPIHVIPNGVDTERFWRVDPSEARRALGLSAGERLIISVGSLTEGKGHQLLIPAFQHVRLKYPDAKLYILGEGPYRGALERIVRELRLEGQLQMPGRVPNDALRSWFSAADVSCLASSGEGWPNAITESLACGTPVVATRVGGIPEILHCGELGILVDGTVDSVAAGLVQALGRNWNHETISAQTRARTWDVVGAEVERALTSLVPPRIAGAQGLPH